MFATIKCGLFILLGIGCTSTDTDYRHSKDVDHYVLQYHLFDDKWNGSGRSFNFQMLINTAKQYTRSIGNMTYRVVAVYDDQTQEVVFQRTAPSNRDTDIKWRTPPPELPKN